MDGYTKNVQTDRDGIINTCYLETYTYVNGNKYL